MKEKKENFVIFAHEGTYDKLYQVVTIALTAAAMGRNVHIILFFWALKKFYSHELDRPDFSAEYQKESDGIINRMKEKKVPPLSEMLKDARGMGVKIIVCSAGLEFMGIDKSVRPELIDDIWGLPKVLTTVEESETVLYI